MVKRSLVIGLILIFLTLSLTGCWNRREIERLGFVIGCGVDSPGEEKGYNLTVQVAKPGAMKKNGGTPGEKAYEVFNGQGKTFFEAVRAITKEVPRRLFWAHNQFVLVGEKAARDGILDELDFVERDAELRRTFWIIIAKGEARKILQADLKINKIPAMAINDALKIRGATSEVVGVNLNDFLEELAITGTAPVAPVLTLFTEEGKPKFRFDGTAVFRGEKMIGTINGRETRGMLWVKGKVKSGIVVIKCPDGKDSRVGIEIIKAQAGVKPKIVQGKPEMEVSIEMEGNVGDQFGCENLMDPKVIKGLERNLSRAIEEEILTAWRKAKVLKADFFGFGEALHKDKPSAWRQLGGYWHENLNQVRLKIKVEAKIRRTGLIVESTKTRE